MIQKLTCLLLIAISWNMVTVSSVEASVNRLKNAKLQKRTVTDILTNKNLWGKDLLTVLTVLEGFQKANESQIAVFPTKVVTTKPLKSEDEAKGVANRLEKALDEVNKNPTPFSRKIIQLNKNQKKSFDAEVLRYFSEDESIRVQVDSLDLFSAQLTVEAVKKEIGQPEKVTKLVIQTEGEQRPLILTLYSYVGGAIVFAEADIAARPGLVNRVIFDVPKIIAALEKEVK